jgi:hypothetical protein
MSTEARPLENIFSNAFQVLTVYSVGENTAEPIGQQVATSFTFRRFKCSPAKPNQRAKRCL